MLRPIAVASVLLACAAPAARAQEQPHPYRPGIDVLDYALSIELPDTGSLIRGDASLRVQRTARVDTLVLDLIKLHVQRVTVNDRSRPFGRTDSTVLVPLLPADTGRFRVRVVYDGRVTDGLIAQRDSLDRWTYFGDNWPNRARFWIPSVDHPSDKATVSWTVRAPTGRTVVANGSLVDTRTTQQNLTVTDQARQRDASSVATSTSGVNVSAGSSDVGGTSGGYASQGNSLSVRGKTGVIRLFDGLRIENGNGATSYMVNSAVVGQTVVETGGGIAESLAGGGTINSVPKSGSNTLHGGASGLFTREAW